MSKTDDKIDPAAPNPDCDMPECVGTREDDVHAARDPSGELLEICDGCLNDGWRAAVELLD